MRRRAKTFRWKWLITKDNGKFFANKRVFSPGSGMLFTINLHGFSWKNRNLALRWLVNALVRSEFLKRPEKVNKWGCGWCQG
jgi:hypothetical protein